MLKKLCIVAAVLIVLLAGFFLYPKPEYEKLSQIQHASHADYIFLKDRKDREWIFKQITEKSSDDQMTIVLEVVAGEIAQALDLPLNHVKMVSAKEDFKDRLFSDYPGSLHLKVSGKAAEEALPWEGFDLHQKFRTPFMIASKGPLSAEEIGLRRDIVTTMSKHEDLQKIVAFDTYLGNIDRSHPNVFHDNVQNRFYGIDMGNCLMGPLPACALVQLEGFMKELSLEEKEGLKGYKKTLQILMTRFPPAELIALLEKHLEKAGFTPNNPLLWDEDSERKLKKWKQMIEENYTSSLKLVEFLENV